MSGRRQARHDWSVTAGLTGRTGHVSGIEEGDCIELGHVPIAVGRRSER